MFLFGEYGIGCASAGVLLTFLFITFVVVALLVLLVGFVVIVGSLYVRCRSVRLDPTIALFIAAPLPIVVSMDVSIDFLVDFVEAIDVFVVLVVVLVVVLDEVLVIVAFGGVVVFRDLIDLDDFDDVDLFEDFDDLVDVEFGSVFDMEFVFEYVVLGFSVDLSFVWWSREI
jgi:hypothetical protein